MGVGGPRHLQGKYTTRFFFGIDPMKFAIH
jgi:hypothetical protein